MRVRQHGAFQPEFVEDLRDLLAIPKRREYILSTLHKRKIRLNTDNTERLGVNATERVFLEYGWLFREKPVADFGIDAEIETVTQEPLEGSTEVRRIPTGHVIVLQIKSGPSYLRPRAGNYAFYSSNMRHYNYWANHWLPVVLVFYDTETGVLRWRKFERTEAEVTDSGWNIDVPADNILNAEAKVLFEQIFAARESEMRRLGDFTRQMAANNNNALIPVLDGLAQMEREIRIRILGYSLWFAPLQKQELHQYLGKFYPVAMIEANAHILCQAGFLEDTDNFYLPNKKNKIGIAACEQAMRHLEDEIIKFISEQA